MKTAFLTRGRDDHAFLHTAVDVKDQDEAMIKASVLLAKDKGLLFVEVFKHLKEDSYASWFRFGRTEGDVQEPTA